MKTALFLLSGIMCAVAALQWQTLQELRQIRAKPLSVEEFNPRGLTSWDVRDLQRLPEIEKRIPTAWDLRDLGRIADRLEEVGNGLERIEMKLR